MGNPLTLLIILIFIFRGLAKLVKRAHKEEEKKEEARPEEWERYFKAIGIPPVEKKKEISLPLSLPTETKETKIKSAPLKREIKKEEPVFESPPSRIPTLSLDKVREGIILSEILGTPHAKK